jgi:hypothetical protein
MSITDTIGFDHIPGEDFLIYCLQKNLHFSINNKTIKRGRLLLFRKFHYFIQIALLTEKGVRENFEIPIPFGVEFYSEDGLIYFDYRLKALEVDSLPKIPEKVTSAYFDKILEIQIITNAALSCL